MRKYTVVAALATTVVGIGAGTTHAAPGADGVVNYKATTTQTSTVISTDAGSLDVDNGIFKIEAADGTTVAGAELSFRVDDFVFPIAADITGNTATLTPQFDLRHAVYRPVALPFEDVAPWKTPYDRELAAWNRLTSTISAGATIGTLVGGITGGAVGCVLGGIAGATVASAAIVGLFGGFVPAAVVGCLGGIIAVGALGTLAGQLFVTAPVAILAAIQYFTTINQPFTPAK
ncbi:hypothetical protein NDR87_34375 [Nocardia sp. CDC159]|uniref:DUF8020 domain-containing protein n=1 Tax=Nocardia pulmonis TaxID=2951408 RepID=A0A9X2EDY8_9NOCA|nr:MULTISPECIES: hypothetical protein [Nocardia]MCM6778580.1 hypothetical protein [Nocardia pulmonis]MCM6791469.1 hypothetical protein [Nocardia sp. CDC159]